MLVVSIWGGSRQGYDDTWLPQRTNYAITLGPVTIVHNGNFLGSKRTFLLGACISTLLEVLGLISRLRGLLTFVSRYFFIRKAPEVIRNTRKGIKRKNRNVRLAPIKLPQCTDHPPLPRCQAIIRGPGARGPSLTIWDAANWEQDGGFWAPIVTLRELDEIIERPWVRSQRELEISLIMNQAWSQHYEEWEF